MWVRKRRRPFFLRRGRGVPWLIREEVRQRTGKSMTAEHTEGEREDAFCALCASCGQCLSTRSPVALGNGSICEVVLRRSRISQRYGLREEKICAEVELRIQPALPSTTWQREEHQPQEAQKPQKPSACLLSVWSVCSVVDPGRRKAKKRRADDH